MATKAAIHLTKDIGFDETRERLGAAFTWHCVNIKGEESEIPDVTDKPCLQFHFNHEQPNITARMFELYEADKHTSKPYPFATIQFNTGHLSATKTELTGIRINPGDFGLRP